MTESANDADQRPATADGTGPDPADVTAHPERKLVSRHRPSFGLFVSKAPPAPVAAPEGAGDPAAGAERPSPRRLARLATILFFDGFRAAPGWMAVVTT